MCAKEDISMCIDYIPMNLGAFVDVKDRREIKTAIISINIFNEKDRM